MWSGDRLTFRASAFGQRASGFIDVYETGVRLEVTLPWLLARFAHAAQRVIGQKGPVDAGEEVAATCHCGARGSSASLACQQKVVGHACLWIKFFLALWRWWVL